MTYVDGFVLAVGTARKEEYIEISKTVADVFKKHGALSVIECWGDTVPDGDITSFPMAVKCKEDETVVFSWIVWPSKIIRDKAHETCMDDPVFQSMPEDMPFDGKRMIMGGFEPIVDM